MSQDEEPKPLVLCVVVLKNKMPREYENYYLAVKGDLESAEHMQKMIAKRGFKAEGRRYFPDEIESLNIKDQGSTDEV
jgi:predicted GNAT family N-acyltransferase